MLRIQCSGGQLARALQSATKVRPVVSLPLRKSRLLSTTVHNLADQPPTKRAAGSRKPRKQDKAGQDNQEQWDGYFEPGSVASQGETDTTSAETDQFNTGIWTSLRARLQSPEKVDENTKPKDKKGEKTSIGTDEESSANPTKPGEQATQGKKAAVSRPKRSKSKPPLEVKTIRPQRLKLKPVEEQMEQEIPKLSHNLDRVLFNPGVYQMQDQRSGVFNFDPYLASIMPVEEFDFDALGEYITSSKDEKLRQLCAAYNMKYCGSTSSMTSILSHFHFLLSAWRRPNFDNLSKSLNPDSLNFTALSRGPAAAFAHYSENGVYAIDADKEYDTENILSMLGKSMEKLLTLPKEDFEKYGRTRSHQLTEEQRNAEESYHYTTLGDFMMRSQLDAQDPRLPGSGVFDLKTRAVVSIRMDVKGYEKGVGYEIRKRFGQWESFEREYYDMIRAAFLKYSLQVRMGRMDGIFVAFHNTQRIFGFQYISLNEMDHAIHGTNDRRMGDQEFKCSIALLNELMDRATKKFPGRTLRLHVETRPTKVPLTYFFVEPVTDEEMRKIQDAGKPSVEQLEREIRGLSNEEREAESIEEEQGAVDEADQAKSEDADKPVDDAQSNDPQSEATWMEMMSKVDEAVENESLGIRSVKEALQEALEQSGLLQDKTELESERYLDDLVSALTAHSSEVKDARESQEAENEARTPEDGRSEATTTTTTLTDLILKVTEGINENRPNLRTFERKVADLAGQSKKSELAATAKPAAKTAVGEEDSDDIDSLDSDADGKQDGAETPEEPQRELLGMYVTIRNQVNGEFVERPAATDRSFDWAVQYTITELPDKRAQRIYSKIKKRRKDVLSTDPRARSADWHRMFKGRLPIITKKGEKYREERTQREAGNPVFVAWDKEPFSPDATSAVQSNVKK